MRLIEELRNIHVGKDIWVIGAGSSLDDYPIDFFEDKICIAVNWVFSVFLDIGDKIEKFKTHIFYSVHEHREPADWIVRYIPYFLKNCFFLLPPSRRDRMVWWEDYNQDPVYMRWGLVGNYGISASDADFEKMAKCIMEKKGECYYVCRGTTLHWATEAAVVLGAKKIYVVGGEGRGSHVLKHGSMYKPVNYNVPLWVSGTRSLARIFKEFGIQIVFYYYGKGEQN